MTLAFTSSAAGAAEQRVLVIGNDSLGSAVSAAMNGRVERVQVERVEDDLLALGRLAKFKPSLVIAHARCFESRDMAASTTAIRQLAPDARLLLVRPADADPTKPLGFDDYLHDPVELAALRAAMNLGELPAADEPPASTVGIPTDPVLLGDVDLVEHLLHRREDLPALAVKLITQHSGIADAQFAADHEAIPDGRTAVPISYMNRTLGFLHAPAAVSADQLVPWALWMGPWQTLHAKLDQLYRMAMTDELTGVASRRYFHRFLNDVLARAADQRFQVTLMVFDIDNFKSYNDRFGHAAGDEILTETARLMQSVVREHDVVARIGGDEFAVIFWDSEGPREPDSKHPIDVQKAAKRFQKAVVEKQFPKLGDQAPGTLTISGGLAGFPWDGRTPEELLNQADRMAMQSKQQGKNAITIGPGARFACQIANGEVPPDATPPQ